MLKKKRVKKINGFILKDGENEFKQHLEQLAKHVVATLSKERQSGESDTICPFRWPG